MKILSRVLVGGFLMFLPVGTSGNARAEMPVPAKVEQVKLFTAAQYSGATDLASRLVVVQRTVENETNEWLRTRKPKVLSRQLQVAVSASSTTTSSGWKERHNVLLTVSVAIFYED